MRTYRAICACLLFCCSAALFFAAPVFGFCFQPHPSLTCDFLNSDAVFTGRVISVRPVEKDGSTDGYYYRLSVLQLFRGPREAIIEVYTGNDSGGYYLDSGKEYLIFASISKGELQISNCDHSAPLSEARQTIRELKRLRIPKDAEIEGRISFEVEGGIDFSRSPDAGTHVNRMHVVIRGKKTYTAISDRNGWFHLHVPPGAYFADVQPIAHWSFHPFDLSVDDPDYFAASAGHCSGLQFIASPK